MFKVIFLQAELLYLFIIFNILLLLFYVETTFNKYNFIF